MLLPHAPPVSAQAPALSRPRGQPRTNHSFLSHRCCTGTSTTPPSHQRHGLRFRGTDAAPRGDQPAVVAPLPTRPQAQAPPILSTSRLCRGGSHSATLVRDKGSQPAATAPPPASP
ncbi:hypothetical protein NDU88_006814 [Pleurodeles waltl]|uniref:Uncharacterized protein n=1 Tax=Pleurodeles waltl TaxID=8319 RepID=A0AAV7P0H8_PLEWA|nr:hypothetical protein NDU88_006814 [Pleurodeles waltl]